MAKKRSKARSSKPASTTDSPTSLPKTESEVDSINTEAIAAALSSISQSTFLKVCRLCETKDGPFLNIFDPETMTAKKTQDLMPFVIAEYDDLPHKICFRCSAKVEELYEFVQKCIKTQDSLRKALGRSGPKTHSSKLWEEKLHKSNISNDDICDALIKKAMAGIEDLPLKPLPDEEVKPIQTRVKKQNIVEKDPKDIDDDNDSDLPLKQVSRQNDHSQDLKIRQDQSKTKTYTAKQTEKTSLDSLKHKRVIRESEPPKNDSSPIVMSSDDEKPLQTRTSTRRSASNKTPQNKPQTQPQVDASKTNVISSESEDSDNSIKVKLPEQINQEVAKNEANKNNKPFDIMNHVSMIKVNGVGVLFQCKLCNRNFLKKEVVISHACAKTGVPKIDFTKNLVPHEPPKPTTVKYINTKIDGEIRRPVASQAAPAAKPTPPVAKPAPPAAKPAPPPTPPPPPQPEVKSKPKIGPASKVKRQAPSVGMVVTPVEPTPETKPSVPAPVAMPAVPVAMPSVEFPAVPNLKSRYKLVPGPNNTFTLMEDVDNREVPTPRLPPKSNAPVETRPTLTRIKPSEVPSQIINLNLNRQLQSQIIDLDVAEEITPHVSGAQPYPVGLFQTVPQASNVVPPPVVPQPVPFTTPAMKKQSYTIVKTGNPSKLLISTKPQPPVEEPPKKRSRKSKIETRAIIDEPQPFNVTLEDSARQKDNGFFTFINVDPLLQPSYVLPTDNIIQESQISTSTPQNNAANLGKDIYACNMCPEKFSREKKLLAHIQSHYSKMDEEDQIREKTVKRRGRRT